MEQATLSPLDHLCYLYPVLVKHENTIPFPQSGTTSNLFQIVRSIPTELLKVKEILIEFFGCDERWRKIRNYKRKKFASFLAKLRL